MASAYHFPGSVVDVTFELPANFVCKVVGPGRFIPLLSFLFGLFSFVSNAHEQEVESCSVAHPNRATTCR